MKTKTTKKEINATFETKICVGYGYLQDLLTCEDPVNYTTRAEGWAADVYTFGKNAIVIGYAPFGNIKPRFEIIQKYDKAARKIVNEIYDFETAKAMLRDLIDEFIDEVISYDAIDRMLA